ncbi:UDP-N-acetylmuramoyl-tripeptide--D-alanyl-D-alanine ligase [Andreprevotia lacus DSM 23236]|jgi:UDP-N-acetylmuramoyl-tripeptide--D-alanyl-D-alanine ligase|uniref:UDP-N-acetylmuramoyl-tripeptide--D-alanyl-D-alanine ligase n=1 Tax=Andreprevotia lacus DSM 23236 TaxID=1121001 RepID=A0A1W1XRU3_9NEIS|nr:UDP-N-acetylmuramoyl-tripeptide--D-alanyl-D-alanine ligase [Andreprevotia lacus]SMC26673.1 UDP-N-acetylmuramoyl-tripeptide--D-alanyl-D-alanine ligase [Andreprevotia lacus DSM 23236]
MMLNLRETALALAGHLTGPGEVAFSRVTTDSRDIRAGDLFVALKGERFDGHDFAAAALAQGAVAVLVQQPLDGGNHIVVSDTLAALGTLAHYWRKKLNPVVVAITGSNGKTTVKEMTATVLAHCAGKDAVLATQGNLNNHIGVPLTLLSLREGHRYAVVEMGMNHSGEIDYLTRLAEPDVALVNNAGSAHLEALGSVEGVARAKGEIFAGLGKKGVAIINADDAYAELWAQLALGHKQLTFGTRSAEVAARQIVPQAGASDFILSAPHAEAQLHLAVPGLHNIRNALAATAVACALGFNLNDIADGLESYQGVKGRLQAKTAFNGARLIDDSYNANPDSMKAAIDVLVGAGEDTVLVLGDIGEIGSDGPRLHGEIGAYAHARGIRTLYTLGEQMQHAAAAFAGAQHFADADSLIAALRQRLAPASVALVKGSRFMRMERVVDALATSEEGQ